MQIGRCISVVGIDPRYRVLIRFRHFTRVANGVRALKVQRCIGHGHLLASEIVGPRRRSQRGLVFLMVLWGFQARVRLLSNARRTLDQSLETVRGNHPRWAFWLVSAATSLLCSGSIPRSRLRLRFFPSSGPSSAAGTRSTTARL